MKNAAKSPPPSPEIDNPRLAHAQKFAAELNDSRLWKMKISYQKRWTPLKRTQQSVRIQCIKPWKQPKSRKITPDKLMDRALKAQSLCIHLAGLSYRARNTNPDLADRFARKAMIADHIFQILLSRALTFSPHGATS